MLFKKKRIQEDRLAEYSSKDELCQVFNNDKGKLYLLALLLTADSKKAEECFVAGLEDAVKGMPVFKDWARKWARVMIIQNAHRSIRPQISENGDNKSVSAPTGPDANGIAESAELSAVMALRPFERLCSSCPCLSITPISTAQCFSAVPGAK